MVPRFIADQLRSAKTDGDFNGEPLFLDLSGFTRMTSALMQHKDDGAGTVARIINRVFEPLVEAVEQSGGFVAGFAGDALTAIFPYPSNSQTTVAHVALHLLSLLNGLHLQRTAYGEFAIDARIGIGSGLVHWSIVDAGQHRRTYCFRGPAEGAAAVEAPPDQPIFGREAAMQSLHQWLQRSDNGRSAGVLQLSGEAGIGKSLLINHFRREIESTRTVVALRADLIQALLNLGVLKDRTGDCDAAIEYFVQARRIAEAIEEQLAVAYTLFSIGATCFKMHDNRKALEYLKDSLKLLRQLKAKGYYGYALSYLVCLYQRPGDSDRAIRLAWYHSRNVQEVGSDVENGRTLMGIAMALASGVTLTAAARSQLAEIAGWRLFVNRMTQRYPAAALQGDPVNAAR
ncbi:MAG: hypothetical protein EA384_08420 [Spirochaetaceae bacterium]|nr:MAG: hypothetical protein EA384_08420 [Spirochaetaceae bacterium]